MLKRRSIQAVVLGAVAVLLGVGATGGQAADSFKPATISFTLAPGASWKTSQTLHLDSLPPKADVVFAVDTTGSMGAAIADAKADAAKIVGRVKSSIAGARFAVVDYKDYPFGPFGGATDYPYKLVRGLTGSASEVQAGLDTMAPGGGGDLPESLNRVFFETYSDTSGDELTPHLLYAAGAPRFLIVLTDDIGHDTGQNATFSACQNTSVTDPGRNTDVVSDDLTTKETLDGLKANNTNVSFVTYNAGSLTTPGAPACHAQMALYTGGLQVTHDTTDSLADQIVALVKQAAAKVDNVELQVQPNEGTPESAASWVTFTPPGPYGPFIAPRDVPYDMKVTVPAGTSPGTYGFKVRGVADGSPRAEQNVTITVKAQAASAVNLTVDEPSVGAGIASLPFSSIPASRVPFLGGTTSALPAGSIPAGSIPAGSIPAGSIPAGSIPAGSIPAGSIPAGSIPAGSIPAGSIPYGSIGLGSSPAGSIPAGSIPAGSIPALRNVLLSQIPLRNSSWDQILAPPSPLSACNGTATGACRPLTAITLEDVAKDPIALGRLNQLPIKNVPLFSTLWRDAPFAALLLGNATLSQLPPPPPYTTWNEAVEANGGSSSNLNAGTNTVFGVYVAGQLGSTPAGSIPAGSIPYGSIPAGSIPAGSIPAGSIAISMTRIGAVPISKLVPQAPKTLAGYVNCSGAFACSGKTLGQADDAGAINPTLTIAELFAALPAGDADRDAARGTTLDQLIAAMLPLSNYPWEELAVSGLQDVANTAPLHYHVDFDLNCAAATAFDVTVNLPAGFFPVLGSTTYAFAGGNQVVGRNPTANDGGDFVFKPDGTSPCAGSTNVRHVHLNFNAYPGLTLGDHTADATVATSTQTATINDQAPVLVVQNHEANDDALTSPVIAKDTLIVGHVADGSDREYFRFPFGSLPRHSKLVAYLNVPEGADFDLVVHKQFSPSLQSNPAGSIPAGSIPVEDPGVFVDNSNRNLPSETLADVPAGSIPAGSIPAGSIPAGSISANRGSASEAAQVVKRDEQGDAIISVSGFNGSHSDKPYVLRLQVVDPPPLPPCPAVTGLGTEAPGTLPAPGSISATKTLFLVNRQRLGGLYGVSAVNALLAAGSPLQTVAARSEVAGAVIPVDGDPNVRAAFTAWDQSPCSVDAANEVVRRINGVIATYRAALPQLRYIVVLGGDQVVPMYRQDDLTTLSPEIDEASDLAFTTNNLTAANALYASAAQNTVLTDGAYGAFTQLTWLGHDLPLAQTPVSRLLETPAEIEGQFQQYLDANGLLDPKTGLTTGYDFLTDGADGIEAGLRGQFAGTPNFASDTLISPTGAASPWTRGDFLAKYFNKTVAGSPAVPDVVSPNAHYSHWLAQPAGPVSSLSQMVTTADVPGADKIAGRIVFTMGCHGGLNVPDNLGGDSARLEDWAQRYLRAKTAVYIANTGFGYGDTVTVALTERLLGLFSKKINSANTSIGEQWVDALTTYYLTAGDYDVFDEKAMIEASFYGLPFYHFTNPGSSPAPVQPSPTADGTVEVASLAPISPSPTAHTLADGRKWWEIGGNTLNVLYRPIQPIVSKDVTVAGKSARGVWVNALTTHDVLNVKPLIAYPRVDSQLREPDPGFRGTFWPANVVSLLRTKSLGQERASVVVKAGQFRPNATGNIELGTQRLVDSIGLDVAYSGLPDTGPPEILQVGGVIHDGGTTFFVRLKDPPATVKKVAILYNTGTQANWTFLSLSHGVGDVWEAHVAGLTTPTHIVGEAMKLSGATGFAANKGENHTSFTDPPSDASAIRIDSPRASATFAPGQNVKADFACSDNAGVSSCTGTVPDGATVDTTALGEHTFTVTAEDLAGNPSTKTVRYFVQYAFQGFKTPVDNPPIINVAKSGSTIPVKWSLVDRNGQFVSDLNVVTSLSSERIPCPSAVTDLIEETTTPTLYPLTYNAGANQFVYTWKTEKSWAGTCRRFFVALIDGTVRSADFQLK